MLDREMVDKLMDYEAGTMAEDEIVPMFQQLINTGLVWELDQLYQDEAIRLIEIGKCTNGDA